MTKKIIRLWEAKEIFLKDHPDYKIMPDLYFRKQSENETEAKHQRDIKIIKLKKKGMSCIKLGKKFGLTRARVWDILRNNK